MEENTHQINTVWRIAVMGTVVYGGVRMVLMLPVDHGMITRVIVVFLLGFAASTQVSCSKVLRAAKAGMASFVLMTLFDLLWLRVYFDTTIEQTHRMIGKPSVHYLVFYALFLGALLLVHTGIAVIGGCVQLKVSRKSR